MLDGEADSLVVNVAPAECVSKMVILGHRSYSSSSSLSGKDVTCAAYATIVPEPPIPVKAASFNSLNINTYIAEATVGTT